MDGFGNKAVFFVGKTTPHPSVFAAHLPLQTKGKAGRSKPLPYEGMAGIRIIPSACYADCFHDEEALEVRIDKIG